MTTSRAAQSEQSRQRILDATIEIAAERGYEGTTVARVSSRAGLPVTSVYWHFTNKDELLAAVIKRSVGRIRVDLAAQLDEGRANSGEDIAGVLRRLVEVSIVGSPDFLRLGLMLVLERRPVETTAKEVFLDYRQEGLAGSMRLVAEGLAEVPEERRAGAARAISRFFQALFDGLFISHELEQDSDDELARRLDLMEVALRAVVDRVRSDALG